MQLHGKAQRPGGFIAAEEWYGYGMVCVQQGVSRASIELFF